VYRLGAAEVEVVARPPRPAPGDSQNASRCRCLAQILRWERITHDLEGWAVSAKAEQRPPLTIAAVGDLQLGDSSISLGYGFRSRYQGREDLGGLFDGVRTALAADIVFGNLECTLSNAGLVPSQWQSAQMRGHPAFAAALRQAGFTVLNVANNHAVQHGPETFRETVALLRSMGVETCGVRGEDPWCTAPAVLQTAQGGRVGVLGYCLRPRQYDVSEPPYAEGDAESIQADVRRLRRDVDHVIVSLHWGEEFVDTPSAAEVATARSLIDAGATLVLGHHPHVVRPVERYGDGVVAYSLGNFVGDMVWYPPLRHGLLLRCVLRDGAAPDAQLLATRIDDAYRPTLESRQTMAAPEQRVVGLAPGQYDREIRRTIQAQRKAGYLHALRNLRRYPLRVIAQLARVTLQHKLASLWPSLSREPRG